MPPPVLIKVSQPCECGDVMRWKRKIGFAERWRLECICGRCGPWRSEPKRETRP